MTNPLLIILLLLTGCAHTDWEEDWTMVEQCQAKNENFVTQSTSITSSETMLKCVSGNEYMLPKYNRNADKKCITVYEKERFLQSPITSILYTSCKAKLVSL